MNENEFPSLPALVEGYSEFRFYEIDGEFCMTTEDLGNCIGYKYPNIGMGKLFARNKSVLKAHRFLVRRDAPHGGRPSFFYSEGGILKAVLLAGTAASKEGSPRLIDRLESLRKQRQAQKDELRGKKRKPHIPLTEDEKTEIRKLHAEGIKNNEIARRLHRNKGGVSNLIKYGNTSGRLIKDN